LTYIVRVVEYEYMNKKLLLLPLLITAFFGMVETSSAQYYPYNTNNTNCVITQTYPYTTNCNYQNQTYTYTDGCYTYEYNPSTQTSRMIQNRCVQQQLQQTYSYQYVAPITYTYTVPPVQNTYSYPVQQNYTSYPYNYNSGYSYNNNVNQYYTYGYSNANWYPGRTTNNISNLVNDVLEALTPNTNYGCYYQNGYQVCY
jgi:hypothetical protein